MSERTEYQKKYYLNNREEILQKQKQYYYDNKEKVREYNKKRYYDNKEEILKKQREYAEKNREKYREYGKKCYQKHKDEYREKARKRNKKTYKKIKEARARMLLNAYKQNDQKYNRGECTITPEWIVQNILDGKCFYCGEDDWTKLGCDRVDNSLPHTPENVVCCCRECNLARQQMNFEEFLTFFR